jgi:hypothetical protein
MPATVAVAKLPHWFVSPTSFRALSDFYPLFSAVSAMVTRNASLAWLLLFK